MIDTAAGKAVETIGTAIDPKAPPGCTPSSLALSADESILLVANANTNNLAVVNVKELGASTPLGFIPTGWYPTSVRVSRDGKTIYVANGKGAGSRANRDGPEPGWLRAARADDPRVHRRALPGNALDHPDADAAAAWRAYSRTVYECSPIRRGDPTAVRGESRRPGIPIPGRVGEPSPIKYVVYIIKENRTYDQVFGDMPEGNGDPQLCLFPEAVTPNHHALAREFVLLDNFYVDGEVSADGHEWTMGAYATDFVERIWPLAYRGDRRVPYPSEGTSRWPAGGGYLWDRAAEKGVSYRSYGEFIENGKTADEPGDHPGQGPAKATSTRIFRSFDMDYPDVKRAERFLDELAGFEKAGEMPRLIILRLPNDHTPGTKPGSPTVTACVGDNDLALGQVVEGLSKSRFWKETAIFVVEDDAQNGSDHVDAHRTVALAISPYTKRHSVDSTHVQHQRHAAHDGADPGPGADEPVRRRRPADVRRVHARRPTSAPYVHRPARVDLNAKNPRDAPMAELSQRLDLEIEDRADDSSSTRSSGRPSAASILPCRRPSARRS